MLVLYRKYRPQNFSQVLGQNHIVKILKNALIYEKISHAYLFCGPRGVGKTTVARILAKAVNCEKRQKSDAEPCNKCFSCSEINSGKSMDLLEIDAASNRGIAEIRDLREKIKFTPTRAKYKVFIIDEVHMLTVEAFNALLKTLEEPPAHCIFILATTAPHKIPATILSRCQRFDFRRLSRLEIEQQLAEIAKKEKIKIEKPVFSLIASKAQGSSRDALTILGQIITLEDKEITYKEAKEILGISDFSKIIGLVDFITKRDIKGSLNLINELTESGEDLNQFTKELLEYLRKLLLLKVDLNFNKLSELNFTSDELTLAKNQIERIKENDLIDLISKILKAKKEVEINNLPQLPLELAILENLRDKEISKSYQPNGGSSKNSQFSVSNFQLNKNQPSLNFKHKSQNLDLKKSITLFEIQKNWPKVQDLARQKNFSLFVFLRSSFPLAFKDGCLTIACRYNLHKERLEDTKTKLILEGILSEVMQEKILVKFCLGDHPKNLSSNINNKKPSSGNGLINLAIDIFEEKKEI